MTATARAIRHPKATVLATILLAAALGPAAQASFVAVGTVWTPSPYHQSADGSTWTQPVSNHFNLQRGIAHGNNVWVAVGATGVAFTSPNAHDWTQVATGATGQFYGVAYGRVAPGSMFAAVGATNAAGIQTVYTSPTGATWTANPTGLASAGSGCTVAICIYTQYGAGQLTAITHGDPGGIGRFVTVGFGGVILTSDDGQIWEPQVSGTQVNLFGVAWSGTAYVATGYDYVNYRGVILRSPDGESWSVVHTGTQYQSYYQAVAHGDGRWIVTGYVGMAVSDNDGLTWTSQMAPNGYTWWYGVTYGEGTWVMVSSYPANGTSYSAAVAISTDGGNNWQTRPATAMAFYGFYSVAYGQGQFAAAGYARARSDDGRDWIHTNGAAGYYQYALGWSGRNYVAAGLYGSLETSPDGREWTSRYSGVGCCNSFRAAEYGAGTWIVVGDAGRIVRSTNGGVNWETAPSGTGSALYGVAHRPGLFVAVGTGGTVVTSEDGLSWATSTSGTTNILRGVAWGGSRFVAVGDAGTMITSPDGITWTTIPSGTGNTLFGIEYAATSSGAKWVAVGAGGTAVTSGDGQTWAPASTGTTNTYYGVSHDGAVWSAVGANQALRSVDGSSWSTSTFFGAGMAVAAPVTPALDCLPEVQLVGIGQNAKVWGGGGLDPYTWTAPGATNPGAMTGAFTERAYSALGSYDVTLTDLSNPGQTATCTVHVVTDPPPPPPPSNGPRQGCGYILTTSAMDPDLYDWTEIDPAQGGGGTPTAAVQYYDVMSYTPGNGFSFNFCGATYESFYLATSGHICMSPTVIPSGAVTWYWAVPNYCGYFYAQNLPNGNFFIPKPAVFGLWTLLNPSYCTGGAQACIFYKVEGTPGDRVLIYEFKDVPIGFITGEPGQTFQIKLHERTSCVEVHYKSVQASTLYPYYPTGAGYQDATGGVGYERFLYPAYSSWSRAQDAWQACPFQAKDDAFLVNEDDATVTMNVIANDVIGTGSYTMEIQSAPIKGTLTQGPGLGEVQYTPFANAVGDDVFTYKVTSGTSESLAAVRVTLQPVNDQPSFMVGVPGVRSTGGEGLHTVPGFAIDIAAGPLTATDEVGQQVTFQLSSNSNPGIFATQPTLQMESDGTGTLRFVAANNGGEATICFVAVDDGGTDTVTNTWGGTTTGDDTGDEVCADVIQNAPPVAYFEPAAHQVQPSTMTFDACPGPVPRCSFDPDGIIVAYLWEFGDGETSPAAAPAHRFVAPGTYAVRLTVWDDIGTARTYQRNVDVVFLDGMAAEEPRNAEIPVAEAGRDLVVMEGQRVQLVGRQVSGTAGAFTWRQETGPTVAMDGAEAAVLTFTAPMLPTETPLLLQFSLRVTSTEESDPDYVNVRVVTSNVPPVADAGETMRVSPGQRVSLDGGLSHDANGDGLTFRWEQVLGPGERAVALSSRESAIAILEAPVEPATLRFRLTVSDGKAMSSDTIVVVVEPELLAAPQKQAPVAQEEGAPLAATKSDSQSAWPMVLGAGVAFLAAGVAVAAFLTRRFR